MQWRIVLWITDTFWTSPTLRIEAIAGLIHIYLYFQKLSGWHQLKTSILLSNHAIKFLLENRFTTNSFHHCLFLENMTSKQCFKIKSSVVNANNCLNEIFLAFDSFNSKFSLGSCLVDNFYSCFFFHRTNCKNKESKTAHFHKLNNIVLNALSNSNSVIVVSDASIKNNVAMSIIYIHLYSNPIKKTLYHVVSVTSTVAELFAIRCGINQAIQIQEVSHIIIITDSIHAVHWIFDLFIHPLQQQLIAISKDLRAFFNKHSSNSIKFWDCPSNSKWPLHLVVNKEMKKFNLTSLLSWIISWDFDKKNKCNSIIRNWHMTFQVSDFKGKQFLNFLDNELYSIKPSYTKRSL